jgi:hypothetical protein
VRAEAFERVLQLETAAGRGTAFTVEHAEREWLITARHLIPEEPAPEVRLRSRHIDTRMRLPFLPPLLDSADVAVAPLQQPITPQLELVPSTMGLMWSQQVYFLGFPFGMATQMSEDDHDRIAFVKQAIVSASVKLAGLQVWYLDGHNNVGFSGGPVVANTEQFATMQVVGIIAGNRTEGRPLVVSDQPIEDAIVPENTGIIVATDIRHALDLIEAA